METREELVPEADAVARELDARLSEARGKATDDGAAEGAYGLVGHPLGHSWSPQIHGVLGSVPYVLHDLEEPQAAEFIAHGEWRGLNITIPHKALAARLADRLRPAVEKLGVANTLSRASDGTITADNTDYAGFSWMLERFCQEHFSRGARSFLEGRKAVVLGSGGASKAVAAVLADGGAETVVVSRRGPEDYGNLVEHHRGCALLVNTTPVGMAPHCPASPLGPGQLEALEPKAVLDVVYNPARTALVLEAGRLGIPAEGGLSMLCAQGWASSHLWGVATGDKDSQIEELMAALTKDRTNVFFCGMPGCGKTGAARRLAHMVRRPFIDLDDAFEVAQGLTPAQFITAHGEAAFRDAETAVLEEYGRQGGLIVATGGGVVCRHANHDLMAQNGVIVFLDRPLDQLATHGRPLSAAKGVETLAAERLPIYREWADLSLACTGSAEGDALAVGQLLGLLPGEVD